MNQSIILFFRKKLVNKILAVCFQKKIIFIYLEKKNFFQKKSLNCNFKKAKNKNSINFPKMELYKSKYNKLSYIEQEALLTLVWTADSGIMKDEDFKNEMRVYASAIKRYKPMRIIFDSRFFEFIIRPEMQEWLAFNVFPEYKIAGVRKKAYIVSEDVFPTVTLENYMNKSTPEKVETRFFDGSNSAQEWLKQ